ncbi:hypothetical protein MUO66_00600 [Candidatus Bathyarchaeota archaeon]|nr:hypothetical protein [Candidatus Bathyarchaeota archaeon]
MYQTVTAQNDRYIPFRGETGPEPEPFPTTIAVASIALIVVISSVILVFFKKYRK